MRCRWELKWSKFALNHHLPASFGTSQWQDEDRISLPYLLYRCVMFAYFWGFFIYDLLRDYTEDQIHFYMIYLTNWTYIAAITDMAVQLVCALTASYRCHKGIKPLVPEWLYKTHWVIVNISHTIAPLVTAMYWAGVFPFLDIPATYADIHLHLLTTLYTLSDLGIHRTPRRFHHVIFPLFFGVGYLLFTIVYYLCGGLDMYGKTGIYPILDWADPGLSTGTAFAALVTVFLLHAATWGLVRLRLKMHGRWLGRKVTVDAGLDVAAGGGGPGDVSSDVRGSTGRASGERDAYANVTVGDGRPAEKTSAESPRRPVDMRRAFDNAGLVVEDGGFSSTRQDSGAPLA